MDQDLVCALGCGFRCATSSGVGPLDDLPICTKSPTGVHEWIPIDALLAWEDDRDSLRGPRNNVEAFMQEDAEDTERMVFSFQALGSVGSDAHDPELQPTSRVGAGRLRKFLQQFQLSVPEELQPPEQYDDTQPDLGAAEGTPEQYLDYGEFESLVKDHPRLKTVASVAGVAFRERRQSSKSLIAPSGMPESDDEGDDSLGDTATFPSHPILTINSHSSFSLPDALYRAMPDPLALGMLQARLDQIQHTNWATSVPPRHGAADGSGCGGGGVLGATFSNLFSKPVLNNLAP
eukprot:gene3161-3691_t